jgi:hypothetical protein
MDRSLCSPQSRSRISSAEGNNGPLRESNSGLTGCSQPLLIQLITFLLQIGTGYLGKNSAWTSRCLIPSETRTYKAAFLDYVKVKTEFLQNMIDWHCDSIMRMLPQDRQSATPVFTFSIRESRSFMKISHKVCLRPETARAFKTVSYFHFDLHFVCPHL